MQFIVTTHSPFVAQAASDNGLFVLRSTKAEAAVEVEQPLDSVKGWRVDQILTSPLFGLHATRDEETETLIRRHAKLIGKRTWGKWTEGDQRELSQLAEELEKHLTAPGETVEERTLQAETAEVLRNYAKQLGEKR